MTATEAYVLIPMVVLIAIISGYIFYRILIGKYYNKRIMNMEDRMDIIMSLPIKFKLDKIKKIAQHNNEYQAGHDVWSQEYEKLLITEHHAIRLNFDSVIKLVDARENHDSKIAIANLLVRLEKWEVEVNRLMKEVDALTEVDALQRIEISKYKETFRSLKSIYQRDRVIMEEVADFIDEDIAEIENAMMVFNELLNRAEFEQTKQLISEISTALIQLAKSIDVVPQIVTYVDTIIPRKGNELVEKYREAKHKGAKLDNINLNDNLHQIDRQLNTVTQLMKTREYLRSETVINNIINLLERMREETERELQSKVSFDAVYKPTMIQVDKLLETYIRTKADIKTIYSTYKVSVNDRELSQKLNLEMKKLSETKNEFEAKTMNILEPYSFTQLIDAIEVVSIQANIARDVLKKQIGVLDDWTNDSKRVNDEYAKLSLVILEIEDKISDPLISSVTEKYVPMINGAKTNLDELMHAMNKIPQVVEEVNKLLADARDYIYNLYNAIHNIYEEAGLAERAIVWANRYRTSVEGAETRLSNAEILFKSGKFTDSLDESMQLINSVEPGLYEKLIDGNNKE